MHLLTAARLRRPHPQGTSNAWSVSSTTPMSVTTPPSVILDIHFTACPNSVGLCALPRRRIRVGGAKTLTIFAADFALRR